MNEQTKIELEKLYTQLSNAVNDLTGFHQQNKDTFNDLDSLTKEQVEYFFSDLDETVSMLYLILENLN